jgi:hypothetical protein
MLTRKQALLTVALMTGLPLASWAATEAATTAAAPATPIVQPCPFGGPDADGDGPAGMMRHGKMMKGHEGGAQQGMHMRMNDTEALQKQLDEIKDPTVKAKFIDMVKARLAFDQAQLEATKTFLDKQK